MKRDEKDRKRIPQSFSLKRESGLGARNLLNVDKFVTNTQCSSTSGSRKNKMYADPSLNPVR